MKSRKMLDVYCIVIIERKYSIISFQRLDNLGRTMEVVCEEEWHPASYIEEDGIRLFEELSRRIGEVEENKVRLKKVLISMPGTIHRHSIIYSSSRIGIRKSICAGEYLQKELGVQVEIVHDMDCMLIGAFKDVLYTKEMFEKTLCYILMDEGVGSAFMINGKIHHGAGIAGHISRLVVEKNGAFLQELAARGTLESFVSRPWISKRCVEKYIASVNMKKRNEQDMTGSFRRFLQAMDENNSKELSYEYINIGIKERDEIALSTIQEAAQYMGQAINSIITILHPHEIVLAGNLIVKLEGFYEKVLNEAENLSWPAAWNHVNFRKSTGSRQEQMEGAMLLATYDNIDEVL